MLKLSTLVILKQSLNRAIPNGTRGTFVGVNSKGQPLVQLSDQCVTTYIPQKDFGCDEGTYVRRQYGTLPAFVIPPYRGQGNTINEMISHHKGVREILLMKCYHTT